MELLWSIGIIVLAGIAWHVYGLFSSRVEQQAYTVVKKCEGYEIRTYPVHLIAQTVVQGTHTQALYAGFSIIARYIFGDNAAQTKVAMTAPVTNTPHSQKIAMTAPVTATVDGDSYAVAFVMPSAYTMETLPRPLDERIQIIEVPEQQMAVMQFTGYAGVSRVARMKEKLLARLERDHVTVVGSVSYAGFNDPWTPPWLMRNEVRVPLQ